MPYIYPGIYPGTSNVEGASIAVEDKGGDGTKGGPSLLKI